MIVSLFAFIYTRAAPARDRSVRLWRAVIIQMRART